MTFLLCLLLLLPAAAAAQPPAPEALLLAPIPEVFTANRFKQQLDRSASAVTVITGEELAAYGIDNLADALRYATGLLVAAPTASSRTIGIRGSISDLANKILVMVDGRSVYYDFYGHYWWLTLPVPVEEIRQVEIIRGPGSSLYGANAFDGIIHVLTKRPAELPRATAVAAYGDRRTRRAAAIAAYADDKLGVKLSGELFRNFAWRDGDTPSGRADKANLYAERIVDGGGLVSLALGHSDLENEFVTEFLPGRAGNEIRINYAQAKLHLRRLTLQAFVNDIQLRDRARLVHQPVDANATTYDLEASFHHRLGRHLFVGGLTYRHNDVSSSLFVDGRPDLDEHRDQSLYGAYLQDTFPVVDGVEVVAGLRDDHHPLTGENVSPRIALLYTPAPGHTLRLSYARAFRNPSFLESYIGNGDLSGFQVTGGLTDAIPDIRPDLNRDPRAEGITAWELGYRGLVGRGLSVNAELYYNHLEELIETRERFDGSGHNYRLIRNFADGHTWGAEVEVEAALSRPWLLFANATYERVAYDDDADPAAGYNPSGFLDSGAPRWLANLGLRYRRPEGLFATAVVHHTGRWSTYPQLVRRAALFGLEGAEPQTVDGYTTVDASLGYRGRRGLTLTLAARNLLGEEHYELPRDNHLLPGLPLGQASERIGRELLLQLKLEL